MQARTRLEMERVHVIPEPYPVVRRRFVIGAGDKTGHRFSCERGDRCNSGSEGINLSESVLLLGRTNTYLNHSAAR